jgi:uncharacterized protein YbjT (DUF2867 family)
MRIAVAGATGNIGTRAVAILRADGHDVVGLSRSLGADLTTGTGLDAALADTEAVTDVTNGSPQTLAAATANLLAAGARAGVRHHVLLSIVGARRVEASPHYAAKREQERLVRNGAVPWTIVPTTQFHDFAAMVAGRSERDGVATLPPLLVQPVAPDDVAAILAEIAIGPPRGRYVDVAGPDPHDLVDMARRTNQARGRTVRLVPTWSGPLGTEFAGNVLMPDGNARIAPTTFEEWLTGQRSSGGSGEIVGTPAMRSNASVTGTSR